MVTLSSQSLARVTSSRRGCPQPKMTSAGPDVRPAFLFSGGLVVALFALMGLERRLENVVDPLAPART